MKRFAVLVSLVALSLTACSSGGGEKDVPKRAGEPASKEAASEYTTLSKADLKSVVLTLDDMPAGYAVDTDEDEESEDDDFTSGDPGCKELVDSTDGDKYKLDEAEASFTQGDFGPFVAESVTTTKPGKADDSLSEGRRALDSCGSYLSGQGDDAVKFKVGRLSFPNLGDETLAYSLTGEASGFPFSGQIVVIRFGDNIVFLSALGIGDAKVDSTDLEAIARTAAQRVTDKAA